MTPQPTSWMSGVASIAAAASLLAAACASDEVATRSSYSMSFEEFRATVYQEPDTGIYIVDGDTPVRSDDELRAFHARLQSGEALTVYRKGGNDVTWSPAQRRNLTYCVSTTFGANYGAVVAAMAEAASGWEQNADIDFIHVAAHDGTCTAANAQVLFDVRPVAFGQYYARAFFPDDGRAARNVLIDNAAFDGGDAWSMAGILRHELGHTLGFRHEHTRPEAGMCFEDDEWRGVTAYDAASVMHYPQCNGTQTGDLVLTDLDRDGVASIYGRPSPAVCRTAPIRTLAPPTRADLTQVFNDSQLATLRVHPSTGTSFGAVQTWATRDGGWGNDVRWAAGDFDGDGDQDLVGVWNDGGLNSFAVRRASGSSYGHESWASRQGGWLATTQWIPGDFDGDRLTDLAAIWNDGGLVTVSVYRSTGASFAPHQHWQQRTGGWGDTVRWTVGKLDADAYDDLIAIWNDGGSNTLTVRRSTGSAFTHEHWAVRQGGWMDSTQWLAGDFDGNGLTDLAAAWNDGGLTSIAVYPSTGAAFAGFRQWTVRDGGWSDLTRWTAGDVDADGDSDLALAWNDGGRSTLTVRRSNRSSFGHEHWASRTGVWRDASVWCAGTADAL